MFTMHVNVEYAACVIAQTLPHIVTLVELVLVSKPIPFIVKLKPPAVLP